MGIYCRYWRDREHGGRWWLKIWEKLWIFLQCMFMCAWTYILHIYPLGCGQRWCCMRRVAWSRSLSRNHPERIGSSFSLLPLSDSAAQKGKRPKVLKAFCKAFFGLRGVFVCVYVPSVCKHTVYAVSCYCDWQGANVDYSLQCQYWQIKTEKLNFGQWNINPGTQRERETWVRGCQSNTEWH